MADRLFDLLPFAREHYYHPAMMGSWSIKRVLPTIAPDLDYANLDDVQSGDMVEPVYFEMIDPATPAAAQGALRACAAHLLRAGYAGDGAVGGVLRRCGFPAGGQSSRLTGAVPRAQHVNGADQALLPRSVSLEKAGFDGQFPIKLMRP